MAKTTEMTFAPIAGRGIEFAVDGTHAFLRIPLDRKAGEPSKSGKMSIVASTAGGFTGIPGTDLRMNLQAGFSNKQPTA